MPHRDKQFTAAFDALPLGAFMGCAFGRRYVVTRTDFAGGASQKLVAEELGGGDYISLNFYRLSAGVQLKPCEMSKTKAIDFVLDLRPE